MNRQILAVVLSFFVVTVWAGFEKHIVTKTYKNVISGITYTRNVNKEDVVTLPRISVTKKRWMKYPEEYTVYFGKTIRRYDYYSVDDIEKLSGSTLKKFNTDYEFQSIEDAIAFFKNITIYDTQPDVIIKKHKEDEEKRIQKRRIKTALTVYNLLKNSNGDLYCKRRTSNEKEEEKLKKDKDRPPFKGKVIVKTGDFDGRFVIVPEHKTPEYRTLFKRTMFEEDTDTESIGSDEEIVEKKEIKNE